MNGAAWKTPVLAPLRRHRQAKAAGQPCLPSNPALRQKMAERLAIALFALTLHCNNNKSAGAMMTYLSLAVLSRRETLESFHSRLSRPRWTSVFSRGRDRSAADHGALSDHLLEDIGLSRADLAALGCDGRRG